MTKQNLGRNPFAGIRELVWPERCPLCAERLRPGADPDFCPACAKNITTFEPPVCLCCGQPFVHDNVPQSQVCGFCDLNPPAYDLARAYGAYSGNLAESIRRFKYHHNRPSTAVFARCMREADERWLADFAADLVVPIPLHPRRLRERGFNQAVDLAQPIARRRRVTLLFSALVRARDTQPQFGLTAPQRRDNVRGAFQAVRPDQVRDQSVILVDDVITTGATASECAKVLKKAGAARVAILSLARAV